MTDNTYCYNIGLAFYDVARRHSQRTALRFPGAAAVTYEELNVLSNQLVRTLQDNGVEQGNVVAIFNEKSLYAYALMLACLKMGAIYTNLDTTSPWARIHKILDTCEPRLVAMDHSDEELLRNINEHRAGLPVLHLHSSELQSAIRSQETSNPEITAVVTGADPAYIMFTSGSTGFPKGAVMSHSNLLHFIQWGRATFSVTEQDVFTNANPIYFDNSVFDFYTSLFNGATLVPISGELTKSPAQLVKAINEARCTIWFSVPSLLVYLLTTRALTSSDFSSITRIAFGGEGFPKNKLLQLYRLFSERITLYNVYGPTECTCICSSYVISESDFDNMNELAPLGYIAPNFFYRILPTAPGNPNIGELVLGGPCVGLGYYNDPQRTASSFITNSESRFLQVMYKTGDLVEKAANGYLFFRGRIDNQVKHMGYRIELEEVEAAFSSLPYINEVGVVYEKLSAELGQIKAFVSIGNPDIDEKIILADIRKILPPYMVPRVVVILPSLPKNANGKIDRKQLKQ